MAGENLSGTPTTEAQLFSVTAGISELAESKAATYADYRQVRAHATVALARKLSVALVVAGNWSIESDDGVDEDRVRFIREQIMPIREPLLQKALEDRIDYGWSAFEEIFHVIQYGEWEGYNGIRKLKHLLIDKTTILIDGDTGQFAGFKQPPKARGGSDVVLQPEECLLMSFDIEGDNLYGRPLLENVRNIWQDWCETNKGARRYDRKMAGSRFVVYYPKGTTPYNGEETPNYKIAKQLLNTLESSGGIAIPSNIDNEVDRLNGKAGREAWSIDILEDGESRQPGFIERLDYLDKLIVRGLLFPERAILEGKYGTKADSGEHADFAIANMDLLHRHCTRLVNWYLVDRLLALNYGEDARGTIRAVASELSDDTIAWMRKVYEKILGNTEGFSAEFATIDTDALKDELGIPKGEEVADANDDGERDQAALEEIARRSAKYRQSGDDNGDDENAVP